MSTPAAASDNLPAMSSEKFIAEQIKQYGILPEKIKEITDKCNQANVVGIDDKEGYKAVQNTIAALVKHRTGIENKRKSLKQVGLRYNTAIDSEAKRLTKIIQDLEVKQNDKKKKIDDLLKAAEDKKTSQLKERKDFLFANGVVFNGQVYRIGDTSLNEVHLTESSEGVWDKIKAGILVEKELLELEKPIKTEEKHEISESFGFSVENKPDLGIKQAVIIETGAASPSIAVPPVAFDSKQYENSVLNDYERGHRDGRHNVGESLINRLNNPEKITRENLISFVKSVAGL